MNLREQRIEPELLMERSDILKRLHIRPRVFAEVVTRTYVNGMSGMGELPETLELFGATVAADSVGQLMNKRLTPSAVAVLIGLYRYGKVPMSVKAPIEVPQDIVTFSQADEEELLRKSVELRTRADQDRQKRAEERNARFSKLGAISEADFTYSLLNDLFFFHLGGGGGSLRVGGILVTKHLSRYASNSRKTHDWDVAFTWVGRDGQPKEIRQESQFKNNRSNDEKRNWGLPE